MNNATIVKQSKSLRDGLLQYARPVTKEEQIAVDNSHAGLTASDVVTARTIIRGIRGEGK